MFLMSRNQINFIIGAVCVFVLLALGLAFFYISSQKEARAEPKPAASAASVPETIALASKPPHLRIPTRQKTTANSPNCFSAAYLAKAKKKWKPSLALPPKP